MTNEEAKSELMQLYGSLSEEKKKALDVLMAQAEKTCDIEKSNFDVRQYKLDTDTAYECGYNAGLQAQADGEYIRRSDVIKAVDKHTIDTSEIVLDEDITVILEELPSVAIPSVKPQEPCEDVVSRGVFEQVVWERDIAIQKLKELGYEFERR